ncbi:MAG: ABC transporter permease subunit [Deltaproteobacteria bacterium]|nr:ABC transporter permease subunit [Deltaproteobacteria bacterium]MDQ3296703.1 ABC transporter permease subunit [Myxococcota bacterium]
MTRGSMGTDETDKDRAAPPAAEDDAKVAPAEVAASKPVAPITKPAPITQPAAAQPKATVDANKMPPAKKAVEAKEPVEPGIPQPPPWYRTLRADPPAYVRLALGGALIALVLLLWWFISRGAATEAIISPSKLPGPGATFGSLEHLMERDMLDSVIDTLQRVFLGVLLAAVVGVVLGVLAGANRGVSATIAPLVIFLRSVPMGALLPLTVLLFSDGEKQKWMFIFLAVVPFVFSDTVKAISIVPDRYVETAQTLGASNRQIVLKVLVPLSLPDIVTSLRFQFGLALGYIMLAEAGSTIVEHGLGKLIALSEKRGLTEQVYVLLFVIALLAFAIDLLLRTLQRGVFPWRKDL